MTYTILVECAADFLGEAGAAILSADGDGIVREALVKRARWPADTARVIAIAAVIVAAREGF